MSDNTIFDVGIIGGGMAGVFAAYKLAKTSKDVKCIMFDIGRPQGKRRQQLCGWLGVLPNSDGKLYHSNVDDVAELVGSRKANTSFSFFKEVLRNVVDFKTIKDRPLNQSLEKRLKKLDYNIRLNNYSQIYPKDVHALSKFMVTDINATKNVLYSFDNEVLEVTKTKNLFTIQTERQEYKCRKIILCTGRAGWRWASKLYTNFGIVKDNSLSRFGVRVEMPAHNLKEFNRSGCTLSKAGQMEVGPFSWNGTIIPEDHEDLAISAFRSNENRWKTDKVSFQMISNIETENNGFQQTDRIGRLTFILTNDRILKEKVSTLLNDKSRISIIPEYQRIKEDLMELSQVIPDLTSKAYFHVPTLIPLPPRIQIAKNLSTEVDGMFVAGETAGKIGLLSAAMMGVIAATEIVKG